MEANNQNLGVLLPINESNGNQAVNARDLHKFLEIGRDFTSWMKDQIERCDLVENQDYEVFKFDYQGRPLTQKGESDNQHVSKTEYALSINAAKEISMMSQTEKGKQARRYFIACEEKLKEVAVKGYIPPRHQQQPKPSTLSIEDQFKMVTMVCNELKVSKNEKKAALNNLLAQNGLPQIIASDRTEGKKALSATDLLKINGVEIGIRTFFKILETHGYTTKNERATTKKPSGKQEYTVLTEEGLKWGYNEPSKWASNKYDVYFYIDKFPELLKEVGLK